MVNGYGTVLCLSSCYHLFHSQVSEEESNIFCGLDTEFQPRNVVSWRVQQVLSIIRNLSFEVINKAVLAASWPLLKYVFEDLEL